MTDANLSFVARRGPAWQPDPQAVPANPVVNVFPVGETLIEVVRANPDAFDGELPTPGPPQDVELFYDGDGKLSSVEGSVDGTLVTLGYTTGGTLDTVLSARGLASLSYDAEGKLTNLTWT